jgi:hypothetical protein
VYKAAQALSMLAQIEHTRILSCCATQLRQAQWFLKQLLKLSANRRPDCPRSWHFQNTSQAPRHAVPLHHCEISHAGALEDEQSMPS